MIAAHIGELPDSRMRYHAEKRGYTLNHLSRPFVRGDFDRFDMIIGMDEQNISALNRQVMTLEEQAKIHRIVDFCQHSKVTHVPDPYYGGSKGFENVIDLLEDACEGLYKTLSVNNEFRKI